MADLSERLARGNVLLSDGAWGTELGKKGLGGGCPELWNGEHADVVGAVARAYADAGSDIILTNSFEVLELISQPFHEGGNLQIVTQFQQT